MSQYGHRQHDLHGNPIPIEPQIPTWTTDKVDGKLVAPCPSMIFKSDGYHECRKMLNVKGEYYTCYGPILDILLTPPYGNWTDEDAIAKCPEGYDIDTILKKMGVFNNMIDWNRRNHDDKYPSRRDLRLEARINREMQPREDMR